MLSPLPRPLPIQKWLPQQPPPFILSIHPFQTPKSSNTMRLYVCIFEAKDLPLEGSRVGTFAKLHLGRHKSRSHVAVCGGGGGRSVVWNEEFVFRVGVDALEEEEELEVAVLRDDGGGGGGEVVGRVKVPVSTALEEENRSLLPTWFSLQIDGADDGFKRAKDCGKILLTMSLYGSKDDLFSFPAHERLSNRKRTEGIITPVESSDDCCFPTTSKMTSDKGFASDGKHKVFADHLIQKHLPKNEDTFTSVKNQEPIKLSDPSSYKGSNVNELSTGNFEEALECMQSKEGQEMPENLHGGILLDQKYIIAPKDLNSILFAPQSQFRQDLEELQGTMDYQEGPWMQKRLELSCLIRIVTYIKAATKLVKAVKATEEQTYLKVDGKEFAVLTSVSTPDVPYGNCFKVELLFKITPGPNLSTGELSSHLVISWAVNFHQSTVMKGMIEGGVRQGLKESYNQFADVLAQKVKPVNSTEFELNKDQVLASLYQEHHSDWDLAVEYFCNFTVVVTIFMGLYILVHILLSRSSVKQGLEFYGLDLPDSFGELITSGIFVLQAARVYNMILHFIQARFRKGSDHGVKAQGDGWLLSVALIEGNNLLPEDSNVFSDPYVVFTCNGKSRTSSVQLQTFDPQWNDILEFDAMQEPPSVLDVEVFDFDGPFDQALSLGHAKINFLKYTSAELADLWIPLEGKLAQASQARLHLRVFLDNSKGAEAIRKYLKKMEKEVGKKLNPQPPHRNSQFQKLFGLPPEEFLIKDYSCYLRKRIPLQGRLFLSARIVGFYSNIFGHKTKFFFLWEDIDDIQVISPSLASVGTPSLMMILRPSRGFAARHGAKSQDEKGRFKFFFQSFVSFNAASRTIMALWRTRTVNLEHSAKLAEDLVEQGGKSVQIEDTSSFLTVEDANLLKIYSGGFPFSMDFLTRIFDGGNLEQKIMTKAGCFNYTTSPWELVKSDVYERHVRYKFSRYVSIFGGGVTSTQQKTSRPDGDGWVIDEVMTLHEIPFSDHFRVKFRYQIACSVTNGCCCDVYIAIVWLKNIKFQRRVTRNIREKFTHRVKEIFELAKKDFLGMDGG